MIRITIPTTEQTPTATLPLLDAVKKQLGVAPNLMKLVGSNAEGVGRASSMKKTPALMAQLEMSTYRARMERGIIIHVEACAWNCPQHITPRYAKAEVDHLLSPLR